MPIKFFTIGGQIDDIASLNVDELVFEEEIAREINVQDFIEKLKKY